MSGPSILCPVDFSEASRSAVRHGAAIAEHFGSRLVVMTVNDALLAEATAMNTSAAAVKADSIDALRHLFSEAVDRSLKGVSVVFEAPTGKPHEEILAAARAHRCNLIVISSHGLTGFRKMFFGSTTERVLRETPVPVLIVPGNQRGPESVADAVASIRRILAPVLVHAPSQPQLAFVRGLSDMLKVPTLLLHVVEPVRSVLPHSERVLASVERERRARAETALEQLASDLGGARTEALIAYGEPAEEIVKVADDRKAGLIVMTLVGSALEGPRIGSVTYRVLSAAGRMVLALPAVPRGANAARDFSHRTKKAAPGQPVRKARQ